MDRVSRLDMWIAQTAKKSGLFLGWGAGLAVLSVLGVGFIYQKYLPNPAPDCQTVWSEILKAAHNGEGLGVASACVCCVAVASIVLFVLGLLVAYADRVKFADPVEPMVKQTMIVGFVYGLVAFFRRPDILTDISTMFKHAVTMDLSEADEAWFRSLQLGEWRSYVQAFDFDGWGVYCICCLLTIYFLNVVFKHRWFFEGNAAYRFFYPVGLLLVFPIGAVFSFPLAYAGVAWLLIAVTTVLGIIVVIGFVFGTLVFVRTGISAVAPSAEERRPRPCHRGVYSETDGRWHDTFSDGTSIVDIVNIEGTPLWRSTDRPDEIYEEGWGGYRKIVEEEKQQMQLP